MTIGQLLSIYRKHKDIDRLDIELIILHVIKQERSWLFSHSEDLLDPNSLNQIKQLIEVAKNGKPVAYILGFKEFWGLKLKIDEQTLIPRPETELLIENIIELPEKPLSILDLGTGSGAIAIALAKELPLSKITAIDYSDSALDIARWNAKSHKLSHIEFIQSNWFKSLTDRRFDLIVSNPPYIDENDPHLKNLGFEPITALKANKKGMADIEHIIQHAVNHLNKAGRLMLEHGYKQKSAVQEVFRNTGYLEIVTRKDLSGNDRLTTAIYPARR